MTCLTPRQLQILRWLDENPSYEAGWTVNGKNPTAKHSHKDWTHMRIAGPLGSILVASEDNKALHQYVVGCPTKDKIYGPSDAGKAALKAAAGTNPGT